MSTIDDARPGRSSATRVPPHNLQAEESLLGAMLLSKEAVSIASETLTADNFYKPAHAHIFDAISSLAAIGEPADPVTVAEELSRAGLLEAAGGPATLVTLQASTPAVSNAARYARIIEEHALLRRLIGVAGEIAEMSYGLPDDVTKTVDQAESMVFEVAQRRNTDSLMSLSDLLGANLDHLEDVVGRGQSITGMPTGFLDLDELLSGLQPNALYVVGARPSMGKTALALGMASNAAIESHRPVLLFSLEMGQLELTQRLLCAEARVDSRKVRTGQLSESDWGKIAHATGRLAEAPIWIDDNPNVTVMEIRSKARRLRSRLGDLGLIVVDYLQLMTGRSNAENRQVEVSEISRGLKILARELECPVVALSQLSRQLEMRADKRPMLADLRESGCLTADTLITRADTGAQVAIGDLLRAGATDIPVWTLDEHYRLVAGNLSKVFASGEKETYELVLRSGRRVKASGNHPFLRLDGWTPLDNLEIGDRVAVPKPDGPWSAGLPVDDEDPAMPAELADYMRAKHGVDVVEMFGHGPLLQMNLRQLASEATDDSWLADLAMSDVFWDEIVDIIPLGWQPVFDATVDGTHNFLANGIVVHNSIEQDADVVMFIYRDDVYNLDSPDRGTAEILVSKHRNGPTGMVRLAFLDHYTKFANMARGT
jgi:replicative DNA helicase